MAMLGIGDAAPDFEAATSRGPIAFHRWAGQDWVILFSHPKFFRPVCATELGQISRLLPAFAARGARVLGVCADGLERFDEWAADVEATQGAAIAVPVAADPTLAISAAYGMLHPQMSAAAPARCTFIIGPEKTVRAAMAYPSSLGRDFGEVLRMLDSLQLTQRHPVATPAGWRPGGAVAIVPGLNEEDARLRFPGGWTALRPYLRMLPQPASSDAME